MDLRDKAHTMTEIPFYSRGRSERYNLASKAEMEHRQKPKTNKSGVNQTT